MNLLSLVSPLNQLLKSFQLIRDNKASVKVITIPSDGKHYYTDFILGNHNWKQKCKVDPGSNINCVFHDYITRFDTTEWSYNLECGSSKTAGGYNLNVEARVLLKNFLPSRESHHFS